MRLDRTLTGAIQMERILSIPLQRKGSYLKIVCQDLPAKACQFLSWPDLSGRASLRAFAIKPPGTATWSEGSLHQIT